MNRLTAYDWMVNILQGNAEHEQLVADLREIEERGPTVAELVGCAKAMRASMEQVHFKGPLLDTCGTGGASVKTFNISTPAAFILAEAGIKVAKHGNRSVTRPSGSADILESSGVNLDLSPVQVEKIIQDIGIAFLFAPVFHPAMRHAAKVRKEIGTRTIFNRLGPLANPALASHQLVGVGDKQELHLMADALHELGVQGIVLHGEPGLDEASPCGPVHYLKIGALEIQTVDPLDFKIPRASPASLAPMAGNMAVSRFMQAIEGRAPSSAMDTIHLNVAFGLLAAEKVQTLQEGIKRATNLTGKRKWDAYLAATRNQK
jgi:anthranilate phosphoribosyltransferase